MNPAQIDIARRALLQRRAALVALWQSELDDERELVSIREADWEDLSKLQRDAGLVDQMAEINVTALRETVAALTRIEDGKYGDCESCGEPIPWERLQALWWACECTTCAGLLEEHKKVKVA